MLHNSPRAARRERRRRNNRIESGERCGAPVAIAKQCLADQP
jgi:hypothetical protein